MSDHHYTTSRVRSDAALAELTVAELYELAGACSVEPADPDVCDACAAYLIGQEKEDAERALAAPAATDWQEFARAWLDDDRDAMKAAMPDWLREIVDHEAKP